MKRVCAWAIVCDLRPFDDRQGPNVWNQGFFKGFSIVGKPLLRGYGLMRDFGVETVWGGEKSAKRSLMWLKCFVDFICVPNRLRVREDVFRRREIVRVCPFSELDRLATASQLYHPSKCSPGCRAPFHHPQIDTPATTAHAKFWALLVG